MDNQINLHGQLLLLHGGESLHVNQLLLLSRAQAQQVYVDSCRLPRRLDNHLVDARPQTETEVPPSISMADRGKEGPLRVELDDGEPSSRRG